MSVRKHHTHKMKVITWNKTVFRVGTSDTENWTLIAKADKDHVWVHLDNYPSAHVIIEIEDPTPEEFEYARQLILEQTKKAPSTATILHAPVRSLKRGNKPGEVIIKESKK